MAMMCDFELRVAIIQAVSLNSTHQNCYCQLVPSPINWVSFVSGADLAGADIVKSRIDLVKSKDCINGSDPEALYCLSYPSHALQGFQNTHLNTHSHFTPVSIPVHSVVPVHSSFSHVLTIMHLSVDILIVPTRILITSTLYDVRESSHAWLSNTQGSVFPSPSPSVSQTLCTHPPAPLEDPKSSVGMLQQRGREREGEGGMNISYDLDGRIINNHVTIMALLTLSHGSNQRGVSL